MKIWDWITNVRIRVFHKDGTVEEVNKHNLITDAGKQMLAGVFAGTVDGKIRYVAVGSSNVTPSATQTALGGEFFRKAVTTQTTSSASVQTTVVLAPADANAQIEEIGWFAGPDASNVSGSGIMIARVLYSHLKNDLEQIQIDRTDTVG